MRKDDVVKSTTEGLAPAFDDAQATALGAIFRCDFLEMNDAMRYAVSRPLGGLGGQIVQKDNCRTLACEVVL